MKKIYALKQIIFFISFVLIMNSTHSQISLIKQWDYRYGGIGWEGLGELIMTPDKGFLCAGTCYSMLSGDITYPNRDVTNRTADFWLIKIDSNGTKQWDRRYGGSSAEAFRSLNPTSDGGYILGGYTESYISGDVTEYPRGGSDFWMVKVDSLGNKQWDKRFGGSSDDIPWTVRQTIDGGYFLAGESSSDSSGDKSHPNRNHQDFWALKTDSLGNKLWDVCIGSNGSDMSYDFYEESNGDLLWIGMGQYGTGSDFLPPGYGSGDYRLIKLNSSGIKLWDKAYGGSGDDNGLFITKLYDGYILGGTSRSDSGGNKTSARCGGWGEDYWIVKIDTAGNKEWDRSYGSLGDEDSFGNVIATSDSGLLITGYSDSPIISCEKSEDNMGLFNAWIVKTDKYGTIHWEKTIKIPGINQFNQGGTLIQTSDDCFVLGSGVNAGVGGYKSQPNWDQTDSTYDMWIIKFCGDSLFTSSSHTKMNNWISVYPNPADDKLHFQLSEAKDGVQLQFFNTYGVLIKNDFLPESDVNRVIDISNLPEGVYVLHLTSGSKSKVSRIIVTHGRE